MSLKLKFKFKPMSSLNFNNSYRVNIVLYTEIRQLNFQMAQENYLKQKIPQIVIQS